MKALTLGECRKSGCVRNQRSVAKAASGGAKARQRGPDIADETGQMADAEPGLDGFGQAEHAIDAIADQRFSDMFTRKFEGCQTCQIIAERNPFALIERGLVMNLRCREIRRASIKRPGDAGDAAADENFGRLIGGTNGHIGIPLREIEGLVADDDIEPNIRTCRTKALEQRRQHVNEKRIIGSDPQFPGWQDLTAG